MFGFTCKMMRAINNWTICTLNWTNAILLDFWEFRLQENFDLVLSNDLEENIAKK